MQVLYIISFYLELGGFVAYILQHILLTNITNYVEPKYFLMKNIAFSDFYSKIEIASLADPWFAD